MYDVYCKHPVLSVPLSNEGKPSKPSVYDYNRVVRWEGLYRAARVLFICYSVRSLRLFRVFNGHEYLQHQQRATAVEKNLICWIKSQRYKTVSKILRKEIIYKEQGGMKQSKQLLCLSWNYIHNSVVEFSLGIRKVSLAKSLQNVWVKNSSTPLTLSF